MDNVIDQTLYNGKVKVRFLGPTPEKPTRHMYYVDGVRKTGVTTICGVIDKSGQLIPWALEEAAKHLIPLIGGKLSKEDVVKAVFASDEAKTKAADLGTEIHDWVELFIKHKINPKNVPMPDMPEDKYVARGVLSFLEWHDTHKVKFVWSEKVVYSKKYDYIGKADFAAKVDGKLCLCDLKTGNGLYNSVMMQTAAYVKADEEESKTKYAGRWAIRISKETEEEYFARMNYKNEIKSILGKEVYSIRPYQIFEAVFLDDRKGKLMEDFNGFLACQKALAWNYANKMY